MAKTEAEVRSITMLDGRVVEFPGKRRLQKTSWVTPDDKLQVRLDFENGESRLLTIRPDMIHVYALHGAEQKTGDSIAGVADIDDAVETVDQLMARLDTGEWTKTAAEGAGTNSMAGASVLARALVEYSGQTIATVRTYLGGLEAKVKKALAISAEVGPIVQRLEQEKIARAAARGKVAQTIDVSGQLDLLKAGLPMVTSAFDGSGAVAPE